MTSLDSTLRSELIKELKTNQNQWRFIIGPLLNEAAFSLFTAAKLHIGVLGSDNDAQHIDRAGAMLAEQAYYMTDSAICWFPIENEMGKHALSDRFQRTGYSNLCARKGYSAKSITASRYMIAAALALCVEAKELAGTKLIWAETTGGMEIESISKYVADQMGDLKSLVPDLFSDLPVLTETQKDALCSQAYIRLYHHLAEAIYYLQFYHGFDICTDAAKNRGRSIYKVLWEPGVSAALKKMYMRSADRFCEEVVDPDARAALIADRDELYCYAHVDHPCVSKEAFNTAEKLVYDIALRVHAVFTHCDTDAAQVTIQKGAPAAMQMFLEALNESAQK